VSILVAVICERSRRRTVSAFVGIAHLQSR
jgi:hypothetical protein